MTNYSNDPSRNGDTDPGSAPDVPESVVDEAERLTRLARAATDPDERAAYRDQRARLVADHGYAARVREEDTRAVLVCYPIEWLESGIVRTDCIDDLDRAVERPLSGPGDPKDWDAVDAHNRAVAARVADAHGPVHGANAHAFADFMGNHYARPVESAGDRERSEFLSEYFPRNAWPSAEQEAVIETSIDLVFEAAAASDDAAAADLDAGDDGGDIGSEPDGSG